MYNADGYAVVCLCRAGHAARHLVHRLVLEAFIGPRPEGMQCRHLDGDPTNNRPANLRWGTPAENGADAVRLGEKASGDRHGLRLHPESCPRGERHGQARLTEKAVRAILQLLASGEKQAALARVFGVSEMTISYIHTGKTWRHVPRDA
jgi:hypothetical protein